jgi:hypothetical protein
MSDHTVSDRAASSICTGRDIVMPTVALYLARNGCHQAHVHIIFELTEAGCVSLCTLSTGHHPSLTGRLSSCPKCVASCRSTEQVTETLPTPTIKIDNHSDPFATVIKVDFGDRLGDLLETVRHQLRLHAFGCPHWNHRC